MEQRILSDSAIQKLLSERKVLPPNWRARLKPIAKSDARYSHRELTVTGDELGKFRVIIRQSTIGLLDFSIILTYVESDGQEYRLLRFNGKHPSQHTNKWERDRKLAGSRFKNVFHVHRATERYQLGGYDIDGFAEQTDEYSSFETALALFVRSNGFVVTPDDPGQQDLFN